MNNHNNLDKFIADIESIKMTVTEKNEMRNHLEDFAMSYTPVESPYATLFTYSRRILATAFVAILAIGSVSQVASRDALPGDTLYPVKIAHENISIATASNDAAKINLEIKRTEKRIQEAAQLAQADKLDTETQKEIVQVIKEQTKKVKEKIETVKKDNPGSALQLNNELKSTIKANSEVLRKVTTSKKIVRKEEPEEATEIITANVLTPAQPNKEVTQETKESIIKETIEENSTTEVAILTEGNLDIPTLSDEEITDVGNESQEAQEEIPAETEVSTTSKDEIIVVTKEIVEVSLAETLLESLEEEVKNIEEFEEEVEQEIIQQEQEPDTMVEIANEESNSKVETVSNASADTETILVIQEETAEEETIFEPEELIDEVGIVDTEITTEEVIEDMADTTETDTNSDEIVIIKETVDITEPDTTVEVAEELNAKDEIAPNESTEITEEIKSLQDILALQEEITQAKKDLGIIDTSIIKSEMSSEQERAVQVNMLIDEKKYKQAFVILHDILAEYREQIITRNAEKELGIEITENTVDIINPQSKKSTE